MQTEETEPEETSGSTLRNFDSINSVKKLANLVGNTPLVHIKRLLEPYKYSCQVFGKCEFRSPSGSSWDRFIVNKIQDAVESEIAPEGTYFVTGGNNGICESLGWVGATGNLRVSVLPGNSSNPTKQMLLKSYGANLILSYNQDPQGGKSRSSLESHIDQLIATSGVPHHSILPFPDAESVNAYSGSFAEEILLQLRSIQDNNTAASSPSFDLIVCADDNKSLLYGLWKKFHSGSGTSKKPIIVGVNTKDNSFTEVLIEDNELEADLKETVKWVTVTDIEAIDMTRRLLREEGLSVGHVSGAVMAAALKAIKEYGFENNAKAKILTVFPDSLSQSPSIEFLSTEWMVKNNYYDPEILESVYWYYDMALENVNPPVVMTVPPDAPINIVWKAMERSNTDRAVVAEKAEDSKRTTIIGVVTKDAIGARMAAVEKGLLMRDVCYKEFGIIDSKQKLHELEALLGKNHWVVKVHSVTVYGTEMDNPEVYQDVIGVINYADFMRYKKKIEAHHLKEYAIKMSDGVPSESWLEKFTGKPVIKSPEQVEAVTATQCNPENNN